MHMGNKMMIRMKQYADQIIDFIHRFRFFALLIEWFKKFKYF